MMSLNIKRVLIALGGLLLLLVLFVIYSIYSARIYESPYGRAKADIAGLTTLLKLFKDLNGRYPTAKEGLHALVECPSGLENSWRQLCERDIKDQFRRPYQYVPADGEHPPKVFSLGKDGVISDDDISE
jgi:type II secretion system protein G